MGERKSVDIVKKYLVLELKPLDILNPGLNYEHSIHGLFPKPSKAYGISRPNILPGPSVKSNPMAMLDSHCPEPVHMKPMFPPKPKITYTIGTKSKLPIEEEDWQQCHDYDKLDLHRIAEKFYQKSLDVKSEEIEISESRQRVCDVNLKLAAFNDILLKQAYHELKDSTMSLRQQKRIYQLIGRLEKLPHLYNPSKREESTKKHVSKWLNRHTDNPEAELVGFTTPDLLEPRRFIAKTEPRLSNSDTNVILGKRQRVDRDDEELEVCTLHDSSSDTLLVVKGDYVRPLKIAKRQIPPQEEI